MHVAHIQPKIEIQFFVARLAPLELNYVSEMKVVWFIALMSSKLGIFANTGDHKCKRAVLLYQNVL